MALGSTNITTAAIRTCLSSTSCVLRELATDPNINVWSRYKSGYLTTDGTSNNYVCYQPPQGCGCTDPRGTNPDTGNDFEEYREGDFRCYNHTAATPCACFPTSVICFGNSTSTSCGIGLTFYPEEIDWCVNSGVYRAEPNWATMSHINIINTGTGTIAGSEHIPSVGGCVSVPLSGVSLTAGVMCCVTYDVAFGVDATHWSVKLGTNCGAGGSGTVCMLRLLPPAIYNVAFCDTNITGGDNPPYTSMVACGTTNHRFVGSDCAIWTYCDLNAFCATNASYCDNYRSINADWYITGFACNPSQLFLAKSASNFVSNNGNNAVCLPVAGSPSSFTDGDAISLTLCNICINF